MTGAYRLFGYPRKRIWMSCEASHIPSTMDIAVTRNLGIDTTSFQWFLKGRAVFALQSEVI